MRSIFEVLQEKEAQLQQLEKEIESLRTAAKIMSEAEGGTPAHVPLTPVPVAAAAAAAPAGEAKKRWP